MNRRDFLRTIGMSPIILAPSLVLPASASMQSNTVADLWNRPRDLWITRPDSGESGRFTYWQNGQIVQDEYLKICRLMRDLNENKTVAMSIGLLNFQYAIQQGIRFYFGDYPFILTSGHRTPRTNARLEKAKWNSQHIQAAANDGIYEKVSIADHFKLASWFGVGGVGIYAGHVHVDAGGYRRWDGGYAGKRKGPFQ